MRVPDEVRQCVVFIGPQPRPMGDRLFLSFIGTAFFISVPSETIKGRYYTYLVTAKHVARKLEGKPFFLRVNKRDGGSDAIQVGDLQWWYHPNDELVDVAVIPRSPLWNEYEYKTVPVDLFLSSQIIEERKIGCGDEVFIVGLFTKLSGRTRNIPIVRMGAIAMMPTELVPLESGDINAYLIEARSIGGLSGSPVFVQGTVRLKQFEPEVFEGHGSHYFLGIMRGHWYIPPQTKNDEISIEENINGRVNMGIAIVTPADKILEVINQPKLKEMRNSIDDEEKTGSN
jgi:hypothetical protein